EGVRQVVVDKCAPSMLPLTARLRGVTRGRDKSHRLRRLSPIAGDWYRPPRRREAARAVQVAATASSLPPNETLHLPSDERPASAARNEIPPNAGCRTRPAKMPCA